MARIRFEHKTLADGHHVITSPDLKGFFIAAETRELAEQEALLVLSKLRERGLPGGQHGDMTAVEFAAA